MTNFIPQNTIQSTLYKVSRQNIYSLIENFIYSYEVWLQKYNL
jgi:hypothetical protein